MPRALKYCGVKVARWEAPQTISGLLIIVDTVFPWTLKFSESSVLWGGNINFFIGLPLHFKAYTHRLQEPAERVGENVCRQAPVKLVDQAAQRPSNYSFKTHQ